MAASSRLGCHIGGRPATSIGAIGDGFRVRSVCIIFYCGSLSDLLETAPSPRIRIGAWVPLGQQRLVHVCFPRGRLVGVTGNQLEGAVLLFSEGLPPSEHSDILCSTSLVDESVPRPRCGGTGCGWCRCGCVVRCCASASVASSACGLRLEQCPWLAGCCFDP